MNPAAGYTLHARLRWRRMLRFHAALIDASVLGSVRISFNTCSQSVSGLRSPALARAMILLAMACLTSSAQSPVRRATQAISKGGAHGARRLRVKFLAIQEWGDRHRPALWLGKPGYHRFAA